MIFEAFNSNEKIEQLKKEFYEWGPLVENESNKIHFMTSGRSFEDGTNNYPEEVIMDLYEDFLYKRIDTVYKDFFNGMNIAVNVVINQPQALFYIVESFIDDLSESKEFFTGSLHLEELKEVKLRIISSIDLLLERIKNSRLVNFSEDFKKDKIKFNLNKKEVCVLFNYLFRNKIIGGVENTEQLSNLLEKHFMYQSSKEKDEYLLISNAKNTMSKIVRDDAHKSISNKLQAILKGY